MDLLKITGLQVVAIKGDVSDRRLKHIVAQFILFSDKKTFIDLEEQDYYAFHDCSPSARYVLVLQNAKRWKEIFDNKNGRYPSANRNL